MVTPAKEASCDSLSFEHRRSRTPTRTRESTPSRSQVRLARSFVQIQAHCAFTVLPHRGSFAESDVPIAGWLFNSPQHIRRISRALTAVALAPPHPFKLKGSRNIILDTVKRGEDDHFASKNKHGQTVILRLYEAWGGHGVVDVVTPFEVESAQICDVRYLACAGGLLLTGLSRFLNAISRRSRSFGA